MQAAIDNAIMLLLISILTNYTLWYKFWMAACTSSLHLSAQVFRYTRTVIENIKHQI